MVDVTVTIIKFEVLDDPDPAPFQGDGDFFGRVRIGSNPFQDNESDQIESNGAFLPYWTFTNTVDRDAMPSTTVTIQILDDDTGLAAPDDLIDLDPIDNDLDLALSLDLDTGFWTGDVPQNTGFSEGDGDTEHAGVFEGGERGRIWFDISLSSTGDIDGDGIPDGVERFGIRDAGGNVTTDMAALGADPCRSTVAIEIDHLVAPDHDHRPDPAALQEAVDAFGDAPVAAVTDCPYAGFPAEPSGVNLVMTTTPSTSPPPSTKPTSASPSSTPSGSPTSTPTGSPTSSTTSGPTPSTAPRAQACAARRRRASW